VVVRTLTAQRWSAMRALGDVLLVGESVELVDQALGMDPAQSVVLDRELTACSMDRSAASIMG
jgi:hypothetical protein